MRPAAIAATKCDVRPSTLVFRLSLSEMPSAIIERKWTKQIHFTQKNGKILNFQPQKHYYYVFRPANDGAKADSNDQIVSKRRFWCAWSNWQNKSCRFAYLIRQHRIRQHQGEYSLDDSRKSTQFQDTSQRSGDVEVRTRYQFMLFRFVKPQHVQQTSGAII